MEGPDGGFTVRDLLQTDPETPHRRSTIKGLWKLCKSTPDSLEGSSSAAVNKCLPGAVFRRPLTPDGSLVFTYFAGRLSELWNLTAADVQRDPSSITRHIHPDDTALIARTLNAKLDDLGPRTLVLRFTTPGGELRYLQVQTFADRQPSGGIVRNGVNLDIRELKRAEASLAESERRFHAIVDNMPGAVWQAARLKDGSRAYSYMSEGFREQTGWSPEELKADPSIVGKLFLETEERERDTVAPASGETLSLRTREFRIRRRDGTICWMRARSIPHRTASGETVWDGVTIDITDEKMREQALQEAQRRLQAITDHLPVGVFERVQPPGGKPKLTFVNSPLFKMLGVSPSEFLGKTHPFQSLMHPDDAGRVIAGIRACTLTKADWREEFRIVLPSQAVRWIPGAAHQHVRPHGSAVWDGGWMDITQEKEAQAESERRAQQVQTELVLAEKLQQRFLWRAKVPAYLETAIHFRPAGHVSGDILFSRRTSRGDFLCFLGDATGHGVVAGLMNMLVVALLDSVDDELTPRHILHQLNDHLEAHNLGGKFVSGIALRIGQSGRLRIANAGHPAAVILTGPGRSADFVKSGGPPLGWFPHQDYEEAVSELNPGATLLLYTDGLTEWPNAQGAEWGTEPVVATAREHQNSSPAELVQAVIAAAAAHAVDLPPPDDVSLVAIRLLPASHREAAD